MAAVRGVCSFTFGPHVMIPPVPDAGFSVTPDVLPPDELAEVLARLDAGRVTRSRAGARHLMATPQVAALALDPRMRAIADRALGSEALPFRATLFDKSAAANWLVVWHQDTALPLRARVDRPGWGPWSTKAGVLYAHAPAEVLSHVVALRLHLDDSYEDNGPLRVLPGTETLGVLDDLRIQELARTRAATQCLVPRGGVVLMRPLLVHASSRSRNGRPRRVLHIEYARSMSLGAGLELAIA
jgi:ectoine hydroxylase-related dioxygenase (phytanoyl-CoA dioxygenase family)